MNHHMVAAEGRPSLCEHLLFFRRWPSHVFSALALLFFSALAHPCFFGFWPLLYLGAGEGQNPIVCSASL